MKEISKIVSRTLLITICLILAVSVAPAQMKSTGTSGSNQKPAVKQKDSSMKMPDIWEVFHNRRSVRKFKSDTVPEADIRQIVDAARMAPTSGNQQPWKFLIIRDRKVIIRMMEACIKESLSRYDANPNVNETRT